MMIATQMVEGAGLPFTILAGSMAVSELELCGCVNISRGGARGRVASQIENTYDSGKLAATSVQEGHEMVI